MKNNVAVVTVITTQVRDERCCGLELECYVNPII
jgi:hypothetical protein